MNRAAVLFLSASLASCISSSPPAPAVRFFDPTPAEVDSKERPRITVRVDSAPHLGREFVVRTGPREVVFDPRHSWISEPRQLVASAIERLTSPAPDQPTLRIDVEAFEVDVQAAPRARVRLVVRASLPKVIEEQEPAKDRTPESLAAAMAIALGRAANGVVAAVAVVK